LGINREILNEKGIQSSINYYLEKMMSKHFPNFVFDERNDVEL
jgi:hypothetical protein